MNVTLYGFPGSCSLTVMIALKEVGWHYDVVVPNLLLNEHLESQYLAINPKGRVPTLIVNGNILTETPAILQYIAESVPGAKLLPAVSDPIKRAQVISRVSWLASSTLAACNRFAVPGNVCADEAAKASVRQSALRSIERDLMLMDGELSADGYWFGDFTIADIFAYFIYDVAGRFGVDVSAMPRLSNLAALIGTRPTVIDSVGWTTRTSLALAAKDPA
jgi:glutathione S-transferase